MEDPLVDGQHRLSTVVLTALRCGRDCREDMPTMMARAVRAVLENDPALSISDAYGLVNRLWLR